MERYEKYKDSGIAWIGEIPEDWNTVALKWISHIYAGGTPDKSKSEYWFNGEIPWLNSGAVNQFIITEASDFITEEGFSNSSAKWIEEGSLVMALAGQGKTKGMTAFVTFRTTCNQSLAVIQPKRIINSNFLLYFLTRNYFYIRGLAGEGKRDGLNLEIIGSLNIPLFDLKEQRSIAAFLDRKTAEMDELIAQKEGLIALYEEEKTAIINEAVTKGINPDVKLKPTAIDWLGDIPEHWKVKKLKYVKQKSKNSFVDGPFGSNLKTIHFIPDGDVYVIDSGYITSGKFIIKQDFKNISLAHFKTIDRSSCQQNDIIIAKIGANFGMSGILPKLDKPSVISGNSLKLTVNVELYNIPYIHYQLLNLKFNGVIDIEVKGSAQPALTMGLMSEMFFTSPPLEEQKAIAEYIEKETAQIDAKIAKTQRIIELQQEYRTALISEAVTGKIKVPELVT